MVARQTFVYAVAFAEDGDARWLEGARHGLGDLFARFLNAEGEMRLRIEADGSPSDAEPMLYDQAFCLLALATASRIGFETEACRAAALRLHARLDRFWRGPHGGFIEHHRISWRANPQMHLFEAALAWEVVDAAGPWTATADEIANLALTRLINPKTGALHEFFNADWTRVRRRRRFRRAGAPVRVVLAPGPMVASSRPRRRPSGGAPTFWSGR